MESLFLSQHYIFESLSMFFKDDLLFATFKAIVRYCVRSEKEKKRKTQ